MTPLSEDPRSAPVSGSNPFVVGDKLVCTDSRENPADPRIVRVIELHGDRIRVENVKTERRTFLTWPKLKREWKRHDSEGWDRA